MTTTRKLLFVLTGAVGALTYRVRQLRGRIELLEMGAGLLSNSQLDHLVVAHGVPDPRTTLKVLKDG